MDVESVLMLEGGYSTQRVAAISGLSFRQLDYYDRTGLLRPSKRAARGSGTRRTWSEADVARALLIASLRSLGATTEALCRVLRELPENPDEWEPFLFVAPSGALCEVPPSDAAYWVVNTHRLLTPRAARAA